MIYFFSSCSNDIEFIFFSILQNLSKEYKEICMCTDNPSVKDGIFVERREELKNIVKDNDIIFIFPFSIDFTFENYFNDNFNNVGIIDWFGRRDVIFKISIYPFYFVEDIIFPENSTKFFWGHRYMPIGFNNRFSKDGLILIYTEHYNLPYVLSRIYHFKKNISLIIDKDELLNHESLFTHKSMDIYFMKKTEFFKDKEIMFCITDSKLVMYQMLFRGIPAMFIGDDPIMREGLAYKFDENNLKMFISKDFLTSVSNRLLMLSGENNKYFVNALKGEIWQQQSLSHTTIHQQ